MSHARPSKDTHDDECVHGETSPLASLACLRMWGAATPAAFVLDHRFEDVGTMNSGRRWRSCLPWEQRAGWGRLSIMKVSSLSGDQGAQLCLVPNLRVSSL